MIHILPHILLPESEIQFNFIRAPGPGGQNVNKVATAVLLKFNIARSSLPQNIQERLLFLEKNKINAEGELIIKASRHRTQERNKQEAILRLKKMIIRAAIPIKKRKKTKPTQASVERRLFNKKLQGKNKKLRQKKLSDDR